MIPFSGKKWTCLVFATYLTFAILGTFTFAVTAPLCSVDFSEDEPTLEGFFTSMDDCLAEGSTIISRARNYSFSPIRNGQFRIVMPFGMHKTGTIALFSSSKIIEKTPYPHIKNTILLKLRI
jgi:hypothetical protein